MEIQEPLIAKEIDKNLSIEVWINNHKTKIIKEMEKLTVGENILNMNDTIGLISLRKKENGSKVYNLYTYARKKKIFRAEKISYILKILSIIL